MWTLEYSEDAERDFELIFDHLFDAYVELGDSPDEAVERTAERIRKLRVEIDRQVDTPYIGTLRPDIHSGIRFLRRDSAAIWLLPLEHSRDNHCRGNFLRRAGPHQKYARTYAGGIRSLQPPRPSSNGENLM